MNKSVVALGVAAALATSAIASVTASNYANAETTLYGSARGSLTWTDPKQRRIRVFDPDTGTITQIRDPQKNKFWRIRNHSSRLGVQGSEDLGNGLSVIYQYEFGVDLTDGGNLQSNRPRVLGLKGGFGQASLGTQWSPYYNVAGRVDVFNATFFNQAKPIFRETNSLYYATPDISGFKAEVLGQFQGPRNADTPFRKNGLNQWSANATYSNGPFGAGVAYIKNQFNKGDNWTVSAGYSFGNFSIGGMYEDGDFLGQNVSKALVDLTEKSKWYALVGTYSFGNNVVRAAYGQLDPKKLKNFNLLPTEVQALCANDDRCSKAVQGDTLYEWAIGLQHNLSKRSRLWVEYQQIEKDFNNLSVGMRHDSNHNN